MCLFQHVTLVDCKHSTRVVLAIYERRTGNVGVLPKLKTKPRKERKETESYVNVHTKITYKRAALKERHSRVFCR